MKKILFLILILYSCNDPAKLQPAYILMGQSNACVSLAQAMQEKTNVPVLQVYHPGHPIEHWYTNTKQAYTTYDENYIINSGYYPIAMFWFQGEQNCYDEWEQYYFGAYTSNLFQYIKKTYNQIPINIFEIGYSGVNPEVLNNINWIRAEQEWLHSYYGGILIDTQSYERLDPWHLSPEAYQQLGYDMIQLYEE